ncbi:MAG: Trk system potassium transporter TrkA [Clostridia bacterium]
MNIVIVGAGKVGYALADVLSREQHDVTVVDKRADVLSRVGDILDVMCVEGNGASVRTLMEAGVERTDVLICVTAADEINMVCSLMAKQMGAKYVIARIRDPGYTESLVLLQKEMGIDMVINPERGAALEISRLFRYPFADSIETFARGRVEMVAFRVEERDGIAGIPLKALTGKFPRVLYCAVERGSEAMIPDGDFVIQVGDRLNVASDLETITQFFKKLGRSTQRVRSAMLIGGGHISYYLARAISGMGVDLRIIEIKKEKCAFLSENLEDVTIICGDGTDQELLTSENVRDLDALVCLTDRDEENLMTGLFGVHVGVGKVIVKVNRLNYLELLSGMGMDSVISPKYTTANAILRQVRARANACGSIVEKVYRVVDGQVEALEFTALEGANYLGVPLSQLHIPKGVLVAVLVRDRKIIIPFGSDHIEAGDTVILMAKTSSVMKLEDALQK